MKTWAELFDFYVNVKGYDHGYAAFRADEMMKRKNPHAVVLGRKGGSATSAAKTAAARANAKRPRPRKAQKETT